MLNQRQQNIINPTQRVEVIEPNSLTQIFSHGQAKFGQLGNRTQFQALKNNLIEIEISNILSTMKSDGFIEICVPVLGLTDLLWEDSNLKSLPQQYSVPIAINGFGALDDINSIFSQADFIVANDLIGNEFELLVNEDGTVELPQIGIGLFSTITTIRYIFTYEQICDGRDLSHLEEVGASKNFLYMLPPPGSQLDFNIQINAAYLNEKYEKIVQLSTHVPVIQCEKAQLSHFIEVEKDSKHHDILNIKLAYPKKNYKSSAYTLSLELNSKSGIEYQCIESSSNWVNSASKLNYLTQQRGLSERALTALIRDVFSEFDFTKALLFGEDFNLSRINGFNDFYISPEAIGRYYDMMISGLVLQTIPIQLIQNLIPLSRLAELDLAYAELDEQDLSIINQIKADAIEKKSSLHAYFYDGFQPFITQVEEQLAIKMQGAPSSFLPQVKFNIHTIKEETLSELMNQFNHSLNDFKHLSQKRNYEISLPVHQEAMTIHYQEIVQKASPTGTRLKGFDLKKDKLNLSELVSKKYGLSPEQIFVSKEGSYTNVSAIHPFTGKKVIIASIENQSETKEDDSNLGSFIEFDF